MEKFRYFLLSYENKVNCMPTSYRVLLFVGIIVVAYGVLQLLFIEPLTIKQKSLQGTSDKMQGQVTKLQTSLAQATLQLAALEKFDYRNKLQKIEQQNNDTRKKIDEFVQLITPPKNIPLMLRNLLKKHPGVTILKLQNVPEVPLDIGNDEEKKKNKNKNQTKQRTIYKHGMNIELGGDFLSTVKFLQHVENLSWKLFWDELEYKVEEHPYAIIKLKLHTLSFSKEWVSA